MTQHQRRRRSRFPAYLLAVAVIFGGVACIGTGLILGVGPVPAIGGTTVVFEVTGPGTADITYGVRVDQAQALGVSLPWTFEVDKSGPAVVVAQLKGEGEIVCRIRRGGDTIAENRSTGQFAAVTCSG